jgi:hypothetical protein
MERFRITPDPCFHRQKQARFFEQQNIRVQGIKRTLMCDAQKPDCSADQRADEATARFESLADQMQKASDQGDFVRACELAPEMILAGVAANAAIMLAGKHCPNVKVIPAQNPNGLLEAHKTLSEFCAGLEADKPKAGSQKPLPEFDTIEIINNRVESTLTIKGLKPQTSTDDYEYFGFKREADDALRQIDVVSACGQEEQRGSIVYKVGKENRGTLRCDTAASRGSKTLRSVVEATYKTTAERRAGA